MRNGLRCGAAMLAGKVTGLRDLPDGQKGRFVIVDLAAGGNIVHRLHKTSIELQQSRMKKNRAWGMEQLPQGKTRQHINLQASGQKQEKSFPRPRFEFITTFLWVSCCDMNHIVCDDATAFLQFLSRFRHRAMWR